MQTNLRAIRERDKRSLTEVARAVGLHKSTLSRLETGAYPPDAELLQRLALTLGVSTDEIIRSGSNRIELIGRIGAGSRVALLRSPQWMDTWPGIHVAPLVALSIERNSPWPDYLHGHYAYVMRQPERYYAKHIGRTAVAHIASGGCVYGRLDDGRTPDTVTVQAGRVKLADLDIVRIQLLWGLMPPYEF